MYIWIYTYLHIYFMKPWAPLWKNVLANIFNFTGLFVNFNFSVLIIQVPLGIIKIGTYNFTLQLVSVSMLYLTHSLSDCPLPHSLVMFLAYNLWIFVYWNWYRLCHPRGVSRAFQMVISGHDGGGLMNLNHMFLLHYPLPTHFSISSHCIFSNCFPFLLFVFLLLRPYPWLSHSIVLSMSEACPCVTAEPCIA